jgi:hypothetical protein
MKGYRRTERVRNLKPRRSPHSASAIEAERVQALRPYVASTRTNALDSFRPFRLVPAGALT